MSSLISNIVLVVLVVIVSLNSVDCRWGWGRGSRSSRNRKSHHNFDIGSKRQLTSLYNQRVMRAERVERPLSGIKFKQYPFSHTGTRVTLEDGSKWLVHKGKQFGKSGGNTVVTDAKHMSSRWKTMQGTSHRVHKSTLWDFVKAGGKEYSTLNKNCHRASKKMGGLP